MAYAFFGNPCPHPRTRFVHLLWICFCWIGKFKRKVIFKTFSLQHFNFATDLVCNFNCFPFCFQIHVLEGGKVHIYSRNSEDNTSKYPDIIARMPNVLKDTVKSAVIDSESVAWDREKKQIQPFQVLSTRKRKVKITGASQWRNFRFSFFSPSKMEVFKFTTDQNASSCKTTIISLMCLLL